MIWINWPVWYSKNFCSAQTRLQSFKIKTQKSKPTINFNEFYYINSNHNTAAIRVKATQVFPTFSNYIIFGLDSLKLKGPWMFSKTHHTSVVMVCSENCVGLISWLSINNEHCHLRFGDILLILVYQFSTSNVLHYKMSQRK